MRIIKPILVLCLAYHGQAIAQDSLVNQRLKPLIVGSSLVYGSTLLALNELWYSDFEKQRFRFFNDNSEWQQVDKAGHFYSAFHISKAAHRGLKWAGVKQKKSLIRAGLVSAIILTPIEIFDGFSAGYGASAGDLIANTTGGLLFIGQQHLWGEIRIHPKFSFRKTRYPALRPALLGSNLSEQIMKDYNGQTYWLSVDISRFSKRFPKWLNIAVGYGAEDMVYANQSQNVANGYHSRRQFYLAIDPDFSEYTSKSKLVNTLLYLLTMFKIPAPALAYSNGQIDWHAIFY